MLDGRAAIITGAAGGLGRAMAETFLRAGQAGMVGLTKASAKELAPQVST
jgi:NAD(P)-dependent dehydrogenase (short-subunit alcohol dehydrogenase family)